MSNKTGKKSNFFEQIYGGIKKSKKKKRKYHKKYGKAVFGENKQKLSKRKIEDITEGQIFWVENQYLIIYNRKTTHHPGYISYKRGNDFFLNKGSSKEIGECYKLDSFVSPVGTILLHTGYIQLMPVPGITPEKIGKHLGKLKNKDLVGLKESLLNFLKRKENKSKKKLFNIINNYGDTNG